MDRYLRLLFKKKACHYRRVRRSWWNDVLMIRREVAFAISSKVAQQNCSRVPLILKERNPISSCRENDYKNEKKKSLTLERRNKFHCKKLPTKSNKFLSWVFRPGCLKKISDNPFWIISSFFWKFRNVCLKIEADLKIQTMCLWQTSCRLCLKFQFFYVFIALLFNQWWILHIECSIRNLAIWPWMLL